MAVVKKAVKKEEQIVVESSSNVSEKELQEVRKYFHEFFDINLSVEQGLLFLGAFTKKG